MRFAPVRATSRTPRLAEHATPGDIENSAVFAPGRVRHCVQHTEQQRAGCVLRLVDFAHTPSLLPRYTDCAGVLERYTKDLDRKYALSPLLCRWRSCTCLLMSLFRFDIVVVDEAAQAVELSTLIPLRFCDAWWLLVYVRPLADFCSSVASGTIASDVFWWVIRSNFLPRSSPGPRPVWATPAHCSLG